MDVDKIIMVEEEEEFPAIARLVEMGRQKGYITLDDILHFFPEAEQDVRQLEEAFAALMSAGVQYIEDANLEEQSDAELSAEAEEVAGGLPGDPERALPAVHQRADQHGEEVRRHARGAVRLREEGGAVRRHRPAADLLHLQ